MQQTLKILKSKKAEIHIKTLVRLLISVFVSAFILAAIFAVNKKTKLNDMAIELTRCIQLNGKVTSDFYDMYDVMTENMDTLEKPTYRIETTYIPGTDNIQLGTTIVLRLEQNAKLFKDISIPIKSKGVGNSEIYFKTD